MLSITSVCCSLAMETSKVDKQNKGNSWLQNFKLGWNQSKKLSWHCKSHSQKTWLWLIQAALSIGDKRVTCKHQGHVNVSFRFHCCCARHGVQSHTPTLAKFVNVVTSCLEGDQRHCDQLKMVWKRDEMQWIWAMQNWANVHSFHAFPQLSAGRFKQPHPMLVKHQRTVLPWMNLLWKSSLLNKVTIQTDQTDTIWCPTDTRHDTSPICHKSKPKKSNFVKRSCCLTQRFCLCQKTSAMSADNPCMSENVPWCQQTFCNVRKRVPMSDDVHNVCEH